MELEIKHLSAYLPYELQVKTTVWQRNISEHITSVEMLCTYLIDNKDDYTEFLPILRPIEDLVKEIEIDGLKFIPIMVLFGGENYREYDFTIDIVEKPFMGKKIEISVKDLGSPCITFGLKNPLNNILNYENWQLLLKWHFDVFGLIEKGLAIDINTLSANGC